MPLRRRVLAMLFPKRAPTQTWMFLTFALFVGAGVLVVSLYATTVLRKQTRQALERSLQGQAERVVSALVTRPTLDARLSLLADLSRGSQLQFALALEDSTRFVIPVDYDFPPLALPDTQKVAFRSEKLNGEWFYQAVVPVGTTGVTLELRQSEPALQTMVRQLLTALYFSLLLTLILALIGAWVASRQITFPLMQIRRSAQRILEGQYDEKILPQSRAAEFIDVANQLNRMSDSFRTKIVELERLAHLQSEFIGNVSHEVRNPIFAISGYLEALSSDALPSAQRKRYAEKALAALHRLQSLFNDLIEIARLEYREDLLRVSIFDVQGVLDEVNEMLRPKALEKGLALELDNPSVLIRADRNRIRQVLINLIENAIAYSDEGVVRCRVRRHMQKVRIEVIDNGKGIPVEHIGRIFDRFYRVDPDRSRKSGGTGLGLSIVKQIIQAHGETIRVESSVGSGTRFWFEMQYAGDETLGTDGA